MPRELNTARQEPVARRAIDSLLHRTDITARAVGPAARAALRPGASAGRIVREHRVVGVVCEGLCPREPLNGARTLAVHWSVVQRRSTSCAGPAMAPSTTSG